MSHFGQTKINEKKNKQKKTKKEKTRKTVTKENPSKIRKKNFNLFFNSINTTEVQ